MIIIILINDFGVDINYFFLYKLKVFEYFVEVYSCEILSDKKCIFL